MGKRLYVLSAPGIHLIPTSQPFSACYPDLTEMYAFHLDFTANSAISVTSEIREVLSLKDERSAYTVAGLHKSGNRPALQSFVFHTVLRMVSPFLDAVADRANIFGEFSSLADFIEKGQAGSLSITALARKMGVLPDTLSRRFKRKTGVPLHSFIMRNRLKAAKRMVLSDGTSTENIVQNLGFADRFHFYRFFKQHTGLSPSEYRNQRQTLSIG
jgi:AraC-like DNA-binding protein